MSKEIGLVRHLDDYVSVLDPDRNPSIVDISTKDIEKLTLSITTMADYVRKSQILIISSPLRRAVETSMLIKENINKHRPDLFLTYEENPRIATLRHGKYISTNLEDLQKTEKLAWAAFLDQGLKRQNIFYRHGDPLNKEDGTAFYPELIRSFNSFGENQLEFTLRIYSFIVELIQLLENISSEKLIIISAHASPLLRLHEMDSFMQNGERKIEQGKLYIYEWEEMKRLKERPDVMNILNTGSFGTLDFDNLCKSRKLIEKELEFLRSLSP